VLGDLLAQKPREFRNGQALLLHRVAITYGDRVLVRWAVFSDRVEVDGDTKRSTGLVLPPITPANGARFIVKDRHFSA